MTRYLSPALYQAAQNALFVDGVANGISAADLRTAFENQKDNYLYRPVLIDFYGPTIEGADTTNVAGFRITFGAFGAGTNTEDVPRAAYQIDIHTESNAYLSCLCTVTRIGTTLKTSIWKLAGKGVRAQWLIPGSGSGTGGSLLVFGALFYKQTAENGTARVRLYQAGPPTQQSFNLRKKGSALYGNLNSFFNNLTVIKEGSINTNTELLAGANTIDYWD